VTNLATPVLDQAANVLINVGQLGVVAGILGAFAALFVLLAHGALRGLLSFAAVAAVIVGGGLSWCAGSTSADRFRDDFAAYAQQQMNVTLYPKEIPLPGALQVHGDSATKVIDGILDGAKVKVVLVPHGDGWDARVAR
jgi:hypothetical protein